MVHIFYREGLFVDGKKITDPKVVVYDYPDGCLDLYYEYLKWLTDLAGHYQKDGIEAKIETSPDGYSSQLVVKHSDSITSCRIVGYIYEDGLKNKIEKRG